MAFASTVLDGTAVAVRFLVALVLLGAALPKLLGLREFERAVANYGLVPGWAVLPVTRLIPLTELVFGVALLSGLFVAPVAVLTAGLLLAFSLVVSVTLLQGRKIECGCRGTVAPREIAWRLVLANVVLAGAILFAASRRPDVLVPHPGAGPVVGTAVTTQEAIAILFVVVAALLGRAVTTSATRFRSSVREMVASATEVRVP
jgi:uncharacterized membrane protein YphA (DoxX/SURF4 family)